MGHSIQKYIPVYTMKMVSIGLDATKILHQNGMPSPSTWVFPDVVSGAGILPNVCLESCLWGLIEP